MDVAGWFCYLMYQVWLRTEINISTINEMAFLIGSIKQLQQGLLTMTKTITVKNRLVSSWTAGSEPGSVGIIKGGNQPDMPTSEPFLEF